MDFEDPSLDYEQLAIHIMVKFRRDEPLQLLTGLRQSGGERAVSTILYLIAIQVLCSGCGSPALRAAVSWFPDTELENRIPPVAGWGLLCTPACGSLPLRWHELRAACLLAWRCQSLGPRLGLSFVSTL